VLLCVYQQAAVQFHDERVDAPQALEIGVAHAEVVDGDLESPLAGTVDESEQGLCIVGGRFHQFQYNPFRSHVAAPAEPGRLFQ